MFGCERGATTRRGQSNQLMQRRSDRGESLLGSAVAQLQDLPTYIETNLRAPSVVLDSTKSSDGQDVLATCTVNPDVTEGPFNYVFVPEGNSRFRSLGVKPGDILKYYVLLDEESLVAGIAQEVAMELTVAQVLNDNALLIEGGLSRDVTLPAKIEIWRYEDDRLVDINRKLSRFVERRPPPIGWEPSPDEANLSQIVVRLNQWLRQSKPSTDWKLDPLFDSLDAEMRSDERLKPYISADALAGQFFQPHEGWLLQEAVWLRDISRWGHGDSFGPLERATAIFDWTVRNVQLASDSDSKARPHRPWQILLYGQGTAEERAWVFAMLGWQQGLDVVMLYVEPNDPEASATSPSQFWLPALLYDRQLYLFDTRLGLPIPGPGGHGVATLQQALDDESLLRQLDLEGEAYPVAGAQIKRGVQAAIVADPFSLSRRAAQIDTALAGDDKLSLAIKPSKSADKLAEVAGVSEVRLWRFPFETLRNQLILATSRARLDDRRREALAFQPFAVRPKLWKARTRHFQGRRVEANAKSANAKSKAKQPQVNDHLEARQLYTDPSVRPPDRILATVASADQRQVYETAKLAGTYWLGLLSFDDGNLDVAAHWLSEPELRATGSPWIHGTNYNLARTFESQGKFAEAIELLERDESPQRHGNRLRAKWLQARQDTPSDPTTPDTEQTADEPEANAE